MFDDPPSQASKQGPVAGHILSANPVSEPSDFFPPTPPVPVKNHSTAKIAGAVFGLMFLVGGLAAGVTLLMQPQLLNQKAAEVIYTCGIGLSCQQSPLVGGTKCQAVNGDIGYCCPSGSTIVNGVCQPQCQPGLYCYKNAWGGASACSDPTTSSTVYCCPKGYALDGGYCAQIFPCDSTLLCTTKDSVIGTKMCQTSSGALKYCCPKGYKVSNTACVPR